MTEYSRFTLAGVEFIASGPDNETDAMEWKLELWREGAKIRDEHIPIVHAPIFGYDEEDLATLNEKVEAIIKELKLE